jgi:hypothetical protein
MLAYALRTGVGLMDLMRHRSGRDYQDSENLYTVGGHIDLTVMTNDRSHTETVYTWPDRIGEKINLAGPAPAVPALPVAAGLNRKQRRAMASGH